ncbi:type I toxin-antitoxin system Fst family toxin, partial [Staphylococcus capitis]
MRDIVVEMMTTAGSGWIVRFFAYWLGKGDDKQTRG